MSALQWFLLSAHIHQQELTLPEWVALAPDAKRKLHADWEKQFHEDNHQVYITMRGTDA